MYDPEMEVVDVRSEWDLRGLQSVESSKDITVYVLLTVSISLVQLGSRGRFALASPTSDSPFAHCNGPSIFGAYRYYLLSLGDYCPCSMRWSHYASISDSRLHLGHFVLAETVENVLDCHDRLHSAGHNCQIRLSIRPFPI
jgi:hypothetical protein